MTVATSVAIALLASLALAPIVFAGGSLPATIQSGDWGTDAARRYDLPGITVSPRRALLDDSDRIAALESVQFALTEVGDGARYIWHRANGRISGLVQPTSSFRTDGGEVCRHVKVTLTSGTRSSNTEGIACRLPSGQWRLEG